MYVNLIVVNIMYFNVQQYMLVNIYFQKKVYKCKIRCEWIYINSKNLFKEDGVDIFCILGEDVLFSVEVFEDK